MELTNNQTSLNSPELEKGIHKFIQEKTNEITKQVIHFSKIQSELVEFRLFLSIHANRKKMKEITDRIRKDRDNLWANLLKKYNGDEEKARNYFYN
ncbi:MAG: hypothetical protein AABX29_09995 [Nanoarchaeota archaeon]|mgnify:CR=1 FL=1